MNFIYSVRVGFISIQIKLRNSAFQVPKQNRKCQILNFSNGGFLSVDSKFSWIPRENETKKGFWWFLEWKWNTQTEFTISKTCESLGLLGLGLNSVEARNDWELPSNWAFCSASSQIERFHGMVGGPGGPGGMGNDRIVGGGPAEMGTWPFIVRLKFGRNYLCGGSLIDGDTVLTAAHCCHGQRASGCVWKRESIGVTTLGCIIWWFGWHTLQCNIWFWVRPHKTITLGLGLTLDCNTSHV